jgi:hypothetical protein
VGRANAAAGARRSPLAAHTHALLHAQRALPWCCWRRVRTLALSRPSRNMLAGLMSRWMSGPPSPAGRPCRYATADAICAATRSRSHQGSTTRPACAVASGVEQRQGRGAAQGGGGGGGGGGRGGGGPGGTPPGGGGGGGPGGRTQHVNQTCTLLIPPWMPPDLHTCMRKGRGGTKCQQDQHSALYRYEHCTLGDSKVASVEWPVPAPVHCRTANKLGACTG